MSTLTFGHSHRKGSFRIRWTAWPLSDVWFHRQLQDKKQVMRWLDLCTNKYKYMRTNEKDRIGYWRGGIYCIPSGYVPSVKRMECNCRVSLARLRFVSQVAPRTV